MNDRQESIRDYNRALNAARVFRRTKLNTLLELIKLDESEFRKPAAVSWGLLGTIERQCELIDQMIEDLKSES